MNVSFASSFICKGFQAAKGVTCCSSRRQQEWQRQQWQSQCAGVVPQLARLGPLLMLAVGMELPVHLRTLDSSQSQAQLRAQTEMNVLEANRKQAFWQVAGCSVSQQLLNKNMWWRQISQDAANRGRP